MYSIFSDVRVVEFTSGCPSVASSVVYFTTTVHNPNATNDGQYLTTSKQVAFWEFDRRGAVIKYDAWIPNLRLYANIVAGRGSIVDPLPPAAQAAAIQGLCRTAQSLCKGNNTVYDGLDDCIKILTAKPFGDGDNLWADTVNCRQVHLLLARIRPDVSLHPRLLAAWAAYAKKPTRPIALMSDPLAAANALTSNSRTDTSTTRSFSDSRKGRISCVRID